MGYLSDTLLIQFALRPQDKLTLDEGDATKVTSKYALSPTTFKNRINFVEKNVADYFAENKLTQPDFKPLANGGESMVFDCGNGYIMKMRTGATYRNPKWKRSLQASNIGYSEELNVTYGIYQQAERPEKITLWDRTVMCAKAAVSGYRLSDANPFNFGLVEHTKKAGKKVLKVIDDGAVEPVESIRDIYYLMRDTLRPIYQEMPFVHKTWRAFKNGVKSVTGLKGHDPATDNLPPLGLEKLRNDK